MKYTGYFSDNSDCAHRRPFTGSDKGAAIEFKTLEDLYRFAILLSYEETNWQEFLHNEEYKKDLTLKELEKVVDGVDIGFGSPFLFYATDENGKVVYDIGAVAGWGDEPPYKLEGEEAEWDNLDDIQIPHKVISTYELQDSDEDDWEEYDDDWDESEDENEEYENEDEAEIAKEKGYLKYLLHKETVSSLDSEERREVQELLDKYGHPED